MNYISYENICLCVLPVFVLYGAKKIYNYIDSITIIKKYDPHGLHHYMNIRH